MGVLPEPSACEDNVVRESVDSGRRKGRVGVDLREVGTEPERGLSGQLIDARCPVQKKTAGLRGFEVLWQRASGSL